MAQIKGIEGMTTQELSSELERGGKFVVFQYCFSIIIMTFKRGSDIHFIKSGESAASKSIGFTLLSLVFGWWGFPWGPIYTIGSVYTNLSGGKDITQEILNSLNASAAEQEA